MLTKICPRCGRKLEASEICACSKKRHREYDRFHRNQDSYAAYHNNQWTRLTEQCKRLAGGLDQYAYHIKHELKHGTLSHHIIPVEDDPAQRFNPDNLIYISDKSHAEIHRIYDQSVDAKHRLQIQLFGITSRTRGR